MKRPYDNSRRQAQVRAITYAVFSPDVHHILTVERGWTAGQYEQWLVRSLGALLRRELGTTLSGPP